MRPGRERAIALSGLAYAILVFAGSAVVGGTRGAGRHSLNASAEDVAEFVAGADPTRVWIGEYVAAVGYVLFLVFAAYAVRHVRVGRHGGLPGSAAAGYVALSLAATACLAPVLNRPGASDVAAAFLDLRTVLHALAFLLFAAWLLSVSARAAGDRTLPRWLAASGIAIGLLQFAGTPFATVDPAFTGLPTFAGFLWVAVVSVLLARRPVPPGDAAAAAPTTG